MQQPRSVALLQNNANSRSSTSLITPRVTALSDPPPKLVDAHLLDFLTAEVIRIIITSSEVARTRQEEQEKLVTADFALLSGLSVSESTTAKQQSQVQKSVSREEQEEGVKTRLESMGFEVGWAMAERLARDRPRFPVAPAPPNAPAPPTPSPDALETVKFICKDLWTVLYDKQIDNLRTNHRGVYVLHDNAFKPLARLSGVGDDAEVARMVRYFLAYPCGIIRGALATLGITCTVTAEAAGSSQSTFQVKTTKPLA